MTLRAGGRRIRATIELLIARGGPICGRCGGLVDVRRSGLDPLGPTVGHVMPVARGGSDELDNLALEHRACNLAGGARARSPRAAIAAPIPIE